MSLAQPFIPSPYMHVAMKRRKNTWYTIASGNWSDPNIWMSNSHRRQAYPGSFTTLSNNPTNTLYPTANDDVFVLHNVAIDVGNSSNGAINSLTLNNLFVEGILSVSGANRGLSIAGDLKVNGSLDLSTAIGAAMSLWGFNNYVQNFVSGTSSTVYYARSGDQYIMDLSYNHLGFYNMGTKYLTNNLSIAGNLFSSVTASSLLTLECSIYNLTVNGTTVTNGGIISKTGAGSILFVGQYSFNSGAIQGVNFTGNPTVEFRGGLNVNNGTPANLFWNTGTSLWSFTTNSQTATFGTITYNFTCPISVVGAIDLTVAGAGIMQLNQPISHTVAGRTTTNKGIIYFNSTSSLPSFTTGTFDRTSFANTVGYTMPASITLPYTNYSSLYVSNSGTKTLAGNSTFSGNITLNSNIGINPVLEFSSYDVSITGTTNLFTTGTISKTGAGNVMFGGLLSLVQNNINLLFTGNPTIEFRGGITVGGIGSSILNFGTGNVSITTASQTFTNNSALVGLFFNNATIVGAITLTTISATPTPLSFTANISTSFNSINGTVAGSALVNKGVLQLTSSTAPMTTGSIDYNSFPNTMSYAFNGDFVLPSTTYRSLDISGTGVKSVSGSLTVQESLILEGGSLELSTSNLSVGGVTVLYTNTTLSKSGSGSILFGGVLNFAQSNTNLLLAGNPTVELRGGISCSGQPIFSGTSTFTFTTNNQTISTTSGTVLTLPFNILISGAITITTSTTGTVVFQSPVNGNNAGATLDNRGTIQYQNAQRPMLTGVLQTNLAANTFIYNRAGDQDIKGGTYRTLTLAGSGVKTLTGNVVASPYTLTAPATLNLNGFTRT